MYNGNFEEIFLSNSILCPFYYCFVFFNSRGLLLAYTYSCCDCQSCLTTYRSHILVTYTSHILEERSDCSKSKYVPLVYHQFCPMYPFFPQHFFVLLSFRPSPSLVERLRVLLLSSRALFFPRLLSEASP